MIAINVSVKLEVSASEQLAADVYVPDADLCQRWADSACAVADDCIASLQVVTAEEMQQMNQEYRGKDKTTNVLSFPMSVPEEVGINLLGDLVICADVIATEARQQNKTLDAHWAHMFVLGMLNLLGHDLVDAVQATALETLETTALQKLGFADPYQQQ
jgi:probable rRNA maturation factor